MYTTRFNYKSLIEHVHIIHTYTYVYINLYAEWDVHKETFKRIYRPLSSLFFKFQNHQNSSQDFEILNPRGFFLKLRDLFSNFPVSTCVSFREIKRRKRFSRCFSPYSVPFRTSHPANAYKYKYIASINVTRRNKRGEGGKRNAMHGFEVETTRHHT